MVGRQQTIEASLAAWRDAERRLAGATNGDAEALKGEVALSRGVYQKLSAEHMLEWIDKLHEAEGRRSHSMPSTVPFHEAARDTQLIAAEIWESARASDEDTPQTELNRRRTPRPLAPGLA